MTARDEILAAATTITGGRKQATFTVEQVIDELRRAGSRYAVSTIRTHVTSRMCANAPDNHAVTYDDFLRTDVGTYRLA